jgi:single-strand DNA-binding protein
MANFNLNKVILGGRLTNDVELKSTQSGVSVATFSIAVNRKAVKDKPQETDFINCTAWRNTAEFISKYFKKGASICIVGSLQNRTWNDNEGNKRYATDIVVDEAVFVDSKNNAQGTEGPSSTNYIPDAYKTPQNANFEGAELDSDLPFN